MADEQAKDVQEEEKSATRKLIDRKSEQIKGDLKDMVRNDLIGVDQWKRSKIGALTGFPIIAASIGKVGATISESGDRISSMLQAATVRRELPDIPEDGNAEERFQHGMQMYGLSETNIKIALRNTFWSTWLYVTILTVYAGFLAWSFYNWPARDLVMVAARLGPLPLVLVLLLKHSYANWFFRHRRVGDGIIAFVKSGDYLPKAS